MEFIELQRKFRRVTDAELEDTTESFAYWDQHALTRGIGWSDLLEHRRIMLLAEAGAGKTAEMEERAKRLVQEGRFAFVLPLESLDREPVVDLLLSAEKEMFVAWKADHGTPAWFFLDAVDELKLTKGKLARALRRVSKDLDGHIQRARFIISCRPSDWRPITDLATVKQWLPVLTDAHNPPRSSEDFFIKPLKHDSEQTTGPTEGNADPATSATVQTVAMLRMNDAQIRRFTEHAGVTDATEFLQAISRENAWTFAGRPLDLSDLIETWRCSARLGTRSEQHETNVKGKLKDDPDRLDHGVLNDTKAQLGAERLAFALALTRTRSIRSPEQSPDVERPGKVLDAADILRDWTEEERQALLRRALFDPATYGRVRFHHRSVQEYLAARHLRTLHNQGMSTRARLRLLFAERYGVEVVFPSMRAIAAWLALWDDAVRKELIKREPEALLLEGDPETLDLAAKGDLLRAFVACYDHGSWRGFRFEIDQIRRLAHPELAPVIRECWRNGPVNDDVRHLLVRIIWLGPVPDCADLAYSVAFDTSWSDHDRIVAVRALVACCWDSAVRKVADDMLAQPESWPAEIVHGVAADLFPNVLTVDELITLMERTPEPRNIGSGFKWTSLEIIENLEPLGELAVSLRENLALLIWEGRAETQKFHEIRSRFGHLAPALVKLCERQLSEAPSLHDAALVRCCVIASRFCRDDLSVRESVGKLREHFRVNVALRRNVFWAELAFMDDVLPAEDDWNCFIHSSHESLTGNVIEADRPWLTEALVDQSRPERRTVALHAVIGIWRQRGRVRSDLEAIRAELKGDKKLSRLLEECAARLKRSNKRIRKMDRKHRRREHIQARREDRGLDNWKKWRCELLADPVSAFSSEKLGATVNTLYEWLNQSKKGSNRWNIWDKDALSKAFGQEIADLAETAFRMHWRNKTPVLWAKRPSAARSEIPRQWIHGLLGVSAEASSPRWTASLSSNEARAAAAYATIEMGGFAPFIADLAKSHPEEVNEVIGGEVSAEIRVGGDHTYLPALQNLTSADRKLKQILVPRLLDELKSWPSIVTNETGPRWAQHLDSVLAILGETTNSADREAIAQECRRRYEAEPVGPLALVWLKGLFRFDALRGTQVLTETLADREDFDTRKRAEKVFTKLFGERDAVVFEVTDSAQYAQVLGQLVRLAHAFVRPKDDQVHDGVYSPDSRDHAERARNFLFFSLLDASGPEARRVVLELAGDDDFADLQDYIRLHARQRAAEDAEFAPLTPDTVIALENHYEAPSQDRDGLFDTMMERLDDIALDLADGDFTDRPIVQRVTKESDMQRILARRLRDNANGAYLVTREEEVVDQKYTDIRLSSVKGNQKAVLEVKIADNGWTLKKLEQALRDQLVGKYLRDANCKAGCLLLTYHGRKKYWKHSDTGKRLNFDELVAHLKDKAEVFRTKNRPDVRVTVFGLDLTDPNSRP